MPRVTLGHTGRDLIANRATMLAFVLINAAAVARVCASWHTALMGSLLLIAGALWIAAFGIFELVYGPMLLGRRGDE
ncbi:MAG: NnrS family protein [Steroidobacteraceae bacterium]